MPVSTRSAVHTSAPATVPRPNVSAIPGMSTSTLRALLGAQRRAWDGEYIELHDQVNPNITRLQFNYQYVLGVANRRHQKHRREAQRNH